VRDYAVPRRRNSANDTHQGASAPPASLKQLAEYLQLSPATVSLVLNASRGSHAIPKHTKDRVLAAAKKFKYRANFLARSLRQQRSFTIGLLVPEISEGYASLVMAGIEELLVREGYFYFVASHRHKADLIEEYPKLLLERSVEALIAIDTQVRENLPVPVVVVSGHSKIKGITNVQLDHTKAAWLALKHLYDLGHREIAYIKGQSFSSDTEIRWKSIESAAKRLNLKINKTLVVQLEGESSSPILGYDVACKLLAPGVHFSALFAFNDISAIGAIRAFGDAGIRVPDDISVMGFDDIQSAAFQNPGLTTVRQPLRKMGEIAAEIAVKRINGTHCADVVLLKPELVVRESTQHVSESKPHANVKPPRLTSIGT